MNSTYLQLDEQELAILAASLTQLTISPAVSLKKKIEARLDELLNPEIQTRWKAYRGAVVTKEGTIECDEGALVSEGDDPGAYVMTWTWVTVEAAGLCEGCHNPLDENGEDGFCPACIEDDAASLKD